MAWGKKAGVDDLLQKLVNPKTAKSLYVMSTRSISDPDFVKLASSISTNALLEELYLSGHQLGPLGLQAFADCLATNSTLKHLSLGSEKLGDEAVKILCAGLARNSHSGLHHWDLEFKSIGVDGAEAVAELLKTNKSLTNVSLSRNEIGDEGVQKLAQGLSENTASGVKELHLSETGITGAGLDHLATLVGNENCSLKTIQLSFNGLETATSTFFDALAKNKSVVKLQLKECKLSDEHVAALAAALQLNATLEEVDLSDNDLTQISCASLAGGLRENKALDMGNNALTSTGMTPLLKAKALTQLHLFNNKLGEGLSELLPALLVNSVVETFGIGANQLHEALSVTMFDALHSHPSLKTLEMGGNTLGKEGHEALDRLKVANRGLDVAVDKNAQNEDGSFDFQNQQ